MKTCNEDGEKVAIHLMDVWDIERAQAEKKKLISILKYWCMDGIFETA